jgi:hypothetical protein
LKLVVHFHFDQLLALLKEEKWRPFQLQDGLQAPRFLLNPAATWSARWAQQEYGAKWKTARVEGTIVGFTKAVQGKRSLGVDLWHVKFPEDPKIFKWSAIMLASFEQGPGS